MSAPDRRSRLEDIDAIPLTQPKKKKTWLIFLLCAVALVAVAALCVFGYKYYVQNRPTADAVYDAHVLRTHTASADAGKTVYAPYKGGIVIATQEQTSFYNTKGELKWQLDINVHNPILKISGSYILLAGIDAKDLYILRDGEILIHTTTTYGILNAGIASNGTFFIIEDEPYYKGLLTVRDNKNKDLFVWHSGTSYIIDAAFNERTSQIAVSTLSANIHAAHENTEEAEAADYSSALLLFKMHENAPYQTYTYDNTIAGNVYYASGRYIIVTDSAVHAYASTNGEHAWTYDFLPHTLQRVDFESGRLALLTMAEDGSQTLQVLKADGKLTGEKISGLKSANTVCLLKNILAVGNSTNIDYYNLRGALQYHVALPKAYNDICLFNNGQYLLGTNNMVSDLLSTK